MSALSWPPPQAGCWLHPAVAVEPSGIAGRGLFATAPIAAGAAVSRLGGRLCSSGELRRLIGDSVREYVYTITVDDDAHLLLPPDAPNHYGNHSCEPNLWWHGAYTLAARRDIAAGEELTCDYSTSTADPQFLLRCHCGSSRCRQMVTGDDWRFTELQATYAGHWVPALQQRIDASQPRSVGDRPPSC